MILSNLCFVVLFVWNVRRKKPGGNPKVSLKFKKYYFLILHFVFVCVDIDYLFCLDDLFRCCLEKVLTFAVLFVLFCDFM